MSRACWRLQDNWAYSQSTGHRRLPSLTPASLHAPETSFSHTLEGSLSLPSLFGICEAEKEGIFHLTCLLILAQHDWERAVPFPSQGSPHLSLQGCGLSLTPLSQSAVGLYALESMDSCVKMQIPGSHCKLIKSEHRRASEMTTSVHSLKESEVLVWNMIYGGHDEYRLDWASPNSMLPWEAKIGVYHSSGSSGSPFLSSSEQPLKQEHLLSKRSITMLANVVQYLTQRSISHHEIWSGACNSTHNSDMIRVRGPASQMSSFHSLCFSLHNQIVIDPSSGFTRTGGPWASWEGWSHHLWR